MRKLLPEFYLQPDVVQVAKLLLGKLLVTNLDGVRTSVIITETEAYEGITDKASHAYGNRYTNRTETMYREGGIAYVYLCYGIHHLFNVVTNSNGTPHAVLIRAGQPIDGLATMLERRKKTGLKFNLTNGPGSLSKALGITTQLNAESLHGSHIWIEDQSPVKSTQIIASPRVGVDYAAEDALLPYRFRIRNNPWTGK